MPDSHRGYWDAHSTEFGRLPLHCASKTGPCESTWSKTCVVPPDAANLGRQGSESRALKRQFVCSSVSLSSQPVMSSLMSSLQHNAKTSSSCHDQTCVKTSAYDGIDASHRAKFLHSIPKC